MYRRGKATLESSRLSAWIRIIPEHQDMLCSPTVQAGPAQTQATRKLSGPIQSGEEPDQCGVPFAALVMEFL